MARRAKGNAISQNLGKRRKHHEAQTRNLIDATVLIVLATDTMLKSMAKAKFDEKKRGNKAIRTVHGKNIK